MLEGIVFSNNRLHDVFPSCLGSLPFLKLLILQSSGFYGVIEKPKSHSEFPKLQVIDISFNNFTVSHERIGSEIVGRHSIASYVLQSFCHDNERSSLWEFKESFVINKSGSLCDPKVLQWKSLGVNTSNCCSWDGVQCDEEIGHVIGLDLSRGCLFGSINSNSTLFNLVHLQRLNLAGNNFNYSEIPFAIGKLSGLTYLNLSSYVNISSIVPNFLSNFTSLASLFLLNCGLHGEFPGTTFQLPNLRYLDVGSNRNLKGYLPEFKHKSPLKELILHKNGFSGILRSSIQMLDSLDLLNIDGCKFSGFVPSSLGKLTQLTTIHLGHNNFVGRIPSSLQNLTQLTSLYLFSNHMTGPIPPWLGNLTKLNTLLLGHNQFYGLVPQSLSDIINLETLYLCANNLSGTLKFDMFFGMKFLTNLTLGENSLSIFIMKGNKNATSSKFKRLELGSCNLNTFPDFLRHQNELEVLVLHNNKIRGEIPEWMWNTSTDTFHLLNIANNLLTGSQPAVLRWGTIPKICSNRASNLTIIDLSYNKLQGQLTRTLSNCMMLEGELPSDYIFNWNAMNNINPSPLTYLSVMLNYTFAEIGLTHVENRYAITITSKGVKRYYGNLTVLESLDLSQNKLSGQIPQQLKELGFLERFNVSHNNLIGPIPQGKQFSAFETSYFQGNPGLCGDLLLKKCGLISGLVAGVALGDMVIVMRHGWLSSLDVAESEIPVVTISLSRVERVSMALIIESHLAGFF
nr:receptor-like protein 7 [Ziziphus jujuba var. spinosa]